MKVPRMIEGFSKLNREDRIRLASAFTIEPSGVEHTLKSHLLSDNGLQQIYHEISENPVSNYILPFGVVPNFYVNGRYYLVPMVTEESSVVAAAAAAAKFWATRGGFTASVREMIKPGHVHFTWQGAYSELHDFIEKLTPLLHEAVQPFTRNMELRGGGIRNIKLVDLTTKIPGYYQLEVLFHTADSMGANFINSCLEAMAKVLIEQSNHLFNGRLEVVMSILSNYTPECVVKCEVTCSLDELALPAINLSGEGFARRFVLAVNMACEDTSRAVTHNKGIFNGVDAVVIATGNDFRAVEADGHAYAARDGRYRSLSRAEISGCEFHFTLEIPLAIGTVGGMTRTHPMAAAALKILGNPDAETLMGIVASAGLANNYSALKALITGGIQQGHMQLHLPNLLSQMKATPGEKSEAQEYFKLRKVSYAAVSKYIASLRAMKGGKT